MKNISRVIKYYSVTAILCLQACASRENLVSYLENEKNGLKKKIQIGEVIYDISYRPAELIIMQENLHEDAALSRKKELEGTVCFKLSFSIENYNQSPLRYKVSGVPEYTERQDYYLNKAPKDMHLLYGTDTLKVAAYWFENNQNLTHFETILVAFNLPEPDKEASKDMQFSFYDQVFKNGIIKYKISADVLHKLSKL